MDHAELQRSFRAVRLEGVGEPPVSESGSIRTLPMQGNGAEMLRIEGVAATERGASRCAPATM